MAARKTATKTAAEMKSVLVQVDEETAQLLKTIRDSISGEISENLEKLKSSGETDNVTETVESNFKKLSRRVDNMEDKLEDINDAVETVKSEVHKINLTLNKMMKLLSQMAGEEKSE